MDDVATAIADPARRKILELLRTGPLTAGQITAHFTISRPAVSRHLRVLRESDLVHDETAGRRRYYALNPAALDELADWLARFHHTGWQHRLDALATEVHRTRREETQQDKENTA